MLVIVMFFILFYFKQKTAYELRISYWSSDVCSSDLIGILLDAQQGEGRGLLVHPQIVADQPDLEVVGRRPDQLSAPGCLVLVARSVRPLLTGDGIEIAFERVGVGRSAGGPAGCQQMDRVLVGLAGLGG